MPDISFHTNNKMLTDAIMAMLDRFGVPYSCSYNVAVSAQSYIEEQHRIGVIRAITELKRLKGISTSHAESKDFLGQCISAPSTTAGCSGSPKQNILFTVERHDDVDISTFIDYLNGNTIASKYIWIE